MALQQTVIASSHFMCPSAESTESQSPWPFLDKWLKYKKDAGENYIFQCLACLPKVNEMRVNKGSKTNLKNHFNRMHPEAVKLIDEACRANFSIRGRGRKPSRGRTSGGGGSGKRRRQMYVDETSGFKAEDPAVLSSKVAVGAMANMQPFKFSEEGYASTSGTSRGQSYEDHLSILPTAEEDGLVCEPEEFEEKYQPPMEYYESQAGTSEPSKRGHEMEESENAKRKSRDMMLSDEMLQEEMIPEEVTVTPHIPTTLIDSSSSNSSTTRMMAVASSPASGRASPDVVSTPYQQPNGVQQRPPVCDSPVFLKQTNSIQASTPSEAVTNGTSEPKKQHPRLFPYTLPTPRVMNIDEPYLDAEERRLVLELERRRLNLEEKRLQIEESEKNRRFCLDEKRLQMEEEDRRKTRMNEKKRLELEERRVALMEKKAEPEMRHWKMMDNFMNDALKILSKIITAVEKLQGVTKAEDLNSDVEQRTLSMEEDEQSKLVTPVQSLPDVSETSPKRRKRKRRRSSNLDDGGSGSEESGSENDTPKFSEKETTVLLKEVEEKQNVLLSTSSDSETLAKKKSAWTMVAERVSGSGGGAVKRTAEDVRNVWLSLRRKSRRKCQKITTVPVNLTETERTVIRILSSDTPQMKLKS